MESRRISDTERECWAKYESDRVRVRFDGKRWIMVGSWSGGIYTPTNLGSPVVPKWQRFLNESR